MARRLSKTLKILGAGGIVLFLFGVILSQPEVRMVLAPFHDRIYLALWGEWITRLAPYSHLVLTTVFLMAVYFWLSWLFAVRTLKGILLGLLTGLIQLDRRSRIFRLFLVAAARLRHLRGRKPQNRPGSLSRSYLRALTAVIEDEERRFHGAGDESLRKSLGSHLLGFGELFLTPDVPRDLWAIRHAFYYLAEAEFVGEPCGDRMWEVGELGLQMMLSPDPPPDSAPAPLTVSKLLEAVDDPPPGADMTLLFLCLIHQHLRQPGPGLGSAIRSRVERDAVGLLSLARSLVGRGRLSYGDVRERRRQLERHSRGRLATFNIFAIAPAYGRVLQDHRDTPGLRAWVELLDEVSTLLPAIEGLSEAEGIVPHLKRDIGDARLLDGRTPAGLEATLMGVEEAEDAEDAERAGERVAAGDRALEARFGLMVS